MLRMGYLEYLAKVSPTGLLAFTSDDPAEVAFMFENLVCGGSTTVSMATRCQWRARVSKSAQKDLAHAYKEDKYWELLGIVRDSVDPVIHLHMDCINVLALQ
eukprot:gene9030-9201_t